MRASRPAHLLRPRCLTAALALVALTGLPAVCPAQDTAPEGSSGRAAKEIVRAERYMVVSANPLASEAGAAILAEGGTAVDAAVTTQLMLNLVEPQSSGIGGGAFMLYWDADTRTLTTFDGRETAPALASPDYFLKADGTAMEFDAAVPGGRSVGVPGTLRLLELAHRLHGRRGWGQLIEPMAAKAEAGFEISPRLAGLIADSAEQLRPFAATAAYFLAAGQPKAAGTTLRNPDFAATLRQVAQEGADTFYKGEIARDLVETVRRAPINPGLMTEADLAAYRVKLRPPVCLPYRTYEVCGMGPPGSGGLTVGQTLGILEHFDMSGLGRSADGLHAFAEALKLAFADRDLYMADEDFVSMPTAGLLDPAYLTARAQLISPLHAVPEAMPGNPPWRQAEPRSPDGRDERPGTSHVSIVDPEGNVVSMTTTIESGFGSRLMVRGFLLNNELTDFAFLPEENGRPVANRVEAGKRPRSSMAPTIVLGEAGDPILAIGSPGGSRIIPFVAQALVGILDWGLSPQAAIEMGHVINRNGATELEAGTPVAAFAEPLRTRGHEVKVMEENSGLHAILIGPEGLESGVDPRREGAAVGE